MLLEYKNRNIQLSKTECFSFPPHIHRDIEVFVCTEGNIEAICNDTAQALHPGDAMIAFSNDIHSYRHTGSSAKGFLLIFNPDAFPAIKNQLMQKNYSNFFNSKNIISILEQLYTEYQSDSASLSVYGYLHILCDAMLRDLIPLTQKKAANTDLFFHIVEFLSAHYTEPICLRDLSSRFFVNPYHISRMFSDKYPPGIHKYIQCLRVEHAKHLLTNTEKNIYDILLDSGFSSQKTFNRVFKEIAGCTPREYRGCGTSYDLL